MEAEISAELAEQSKAVVATIKVKLQAKEGEIISESLIKDLSVKSIETAVNNFKALRPFVDQQTLRKQG